MAPRRHPRSLQALVPRYEVSEGTQDIKGGCGSFVEGELYKNVFVIVEEERRADGQRHFVLININPLTCGIVTGIVGEGLSGHNRNRTIRSPTYLVHNRRHGIAGGYKDFKINLDTCQLRTLQSARV